MNAEQLDFMRNGKGFIAALDQSGGSTPKALALYGIDETQYGTTEEMLGLVHEMRTRIIKSPAFRNDYILGAILFEDTLHRTIDQIPTPQYLWRQKGILPFLKVDRGLADTQDGVQLMKEIPGLDELLTKAAAMGVFGTKMRSYITSATPAGIRRVIEQQFDVALRILDHGLVPIIEPEVDIRSKDRHESEVLLLENVRMQLDRLPSGAVVMFKFSLPEQDNFYRHLLADKRVLRIVALSGGYGRAEANEILARNNGIIASFSRALTQGLNASQSDDAFNAMLEESITSIHAASVT